MKYSNIKKITTGPFEENCYLIYDKEKFDAVLIDPGDNEELIDSYIVNNNLSLLAVINTHAHLDHIGAISFFQNKYNIDFYLHLNEKKILDYYEESCKLFGINPKPKPTVTKWLDSESSLGFNDLKFTTINTPGHTPGGVSFLFKNHLFVGDTLFQGSVGRTDLPGGDYSTLQDSLRRLIALLPKETIVHSGHGPDTTLNDEFHNNPFLKFLN